MSRARLDRVFLCEPPSSPFGPFSHSACFEPFNRYPGSFSLVFKHHTTPLTLLFRQTNFFCHQTRANRHIFAQPALTTARTTSYTTPCRDSRIRLSESDYGPRTRSQVPMRTVRRLTQFSELVGRRLRRDSTRGQQQVAGGRAVLGLIHRHGRRLGVHSPCLASRTMETDLCPPRIQGI